MQGASLKAETSKYVYTENRLYSVDQQLVSRVQSRRIQFNDDQQGARHLGETSAEGGGPRT